MRRHQWEQLLLDAPVSSKAKLTGLALATYFGAGDNVSAWPSAPTLAERTSQSDRTVRRALAELEKAKLLKSSPRPGRQTVYRANPGLCDQGTPDSVSPTPDSVTGVESYTPDSLTGVQNSTPDTVSPTPDSVTGDPGHRVHRTDKEQTKEQEEDARSAVLESSSPPPPPPSGMAKMQADLQAPIAEAKVAVEEPIYPPELPLSQRWEVAGSGGAADAARSVSRELERTLRDPTSGWPSLGKLVRHFTEDQLRDWLRAVAEKPRRDRDSLPWRYHLAVLNRISRDARPERDRRPQRAAAVLEPDPDIPHWKQQGYGSQQEMDDLLAGFRALYQGGR